MATISSLARTFLWGALTLGAAAGCGDDDPVSPSGGPGGSGAVGGGAGATGGVGAGGAGGAGGSGAGGAGEYVPAPRDIDFAVLGDLPAGERIAFNDWLTQPNTLSTMAPDGSDVEPLFAAYRVWSIGVANAGDRIAFASGDPLQEEHYGVTIGDAIQHTFLFDVASGSASVLSYGNINDECHTFSADDSTLYVCRRYDFMPDLTNQGYRIGAIDVANAGFSWLTPRSTALALHPAPLPGGVDLWFTEIVIEGGSQQRRIMSQPIAGGSATVVRDDAGAAVLSPDGTRYLYADSAAGGVLMSALVAGGDETLVVNGAVTNARYSPDGAQVVYLAYDDAAACSHVEIVAADGSEANAPTRIRDCGLSGEFITDLAWFTAP